MKRCTEGRAVMWGGALALLASTNFCMTDHDALAKRDRDAGTDASGGSGGSSSGGTGNLSGQGGSAGTGGKYVEPAGRNVVTFLHGVVDAARVAFCFARESDGAVVFAGDPAPASGLDFGQSFATEALAELDFEKDSVVPFVIGGDLDLIAELDCEAAVELAAELMEAAMPEPPASGAGGSSAGGAGGEGGGSGEGAGGAAGQDGAAGAGGVGPLPLPEQPALRVRSLPALPAGTLTGGYSFLFAAEGCLGGPWYVHDEDDEVCGAGYSGGSSLAPLLVVLSRESGSRIGFQAVHASRASGKLTVRVAPPPTGVDPPLVIAADLYDGVVLPRPAQTNYEVVEYGAGDPLFRVELVQGVTAVLSEPWSAVFERGEVDGLIDGENYALVALGPRADFGLEGFWNPPAISIVRAEP